MAPLSPLIAVLKVYRGLMLPHAGVRPLGERGGPRRLGKVSITSRRDKWLGREAEGGS